MNRHFTPLRTSTPDTLDLTPHAASEHPRSCRAPGSEWSVMAAVAAAHSGILHRQEVDTSDKVLNFLIQF